MNGKLLERVFAVLFSILSFFAGAYYTNKDKIAKLEFDVQMLSQNQRAFEKSQLEIIAHLLRIEQKVDKRR